MANWFNNAWLKRQPVVVDNTANSTSALSYFQVGVALTGSAYTSFHANAKSDGSDIRITDADGVTLLNFALEGIDTVNSAVYLLVKVPFVASLATRTIYVYYGNAAATSVSSYAMSVGPTVPLAGPTDIWTQADSTTFNFNATVIRLRNQGGVNGGGSALNGQLVAYNFTGGNSNADRTNSNISLEISTDGGSTWGSKATVLAHDGTHCTEPRSVAELSDGTILMIYSADTPTNANAGKAKMAVAKCTGGPSGTWSNLSLTPGSLLTVPYTYGTDQGAAYHRIFQDGSGNLYAPVYGHISSDTGWHSWLLTCPNGSDPTTGTNWTIKGTIAFDNVNAFSETDIVNTGGSNLLAIMRNDTTAKLHRCTSSNWGATWGSVTAMGWPSVNSYVSPDLLMLASGNILLTWGCRDTVSGFFIEAAVSTDGGTTFDDRAPMAVAMNVGQTSGDGGYPCCAQNADGTIACAYYREVGGVVATCNVVGMKFTEDYVVNCNNLYDNCESFVARWSPTGANATISTTHVHNGTNAIKIDNSAATGGIADYACVTLWPTLAIQSQAKVAYSFWGYETANDSAWSSALQPVAAQPGTSRTILGILGTNSDHIEWFNGTAYQDTGTAVAANRWNKQTMIANAPSGSVSGSVAVNGAVVSTSLGQAATGANPTSVKFTGGSTSSNHNVTFWIDDVYTHQYTANAPAITAGTEQSNTGSAACLLMGF